MVYCGKASQGCQNCRQRRIKCDKINPQCSQCIRIGKQCPGYRDQLSLMFRDESSKVIQKAHAQWNSTGSPTTTSSSTPWPISSSPSTATGSVASPLAATLTSSTDGTQNQNARLLASRIPARVKPTMEQRGLQFFFDNYLMNSPDAPHASRHLMVYNGNSEAIQSAMIAVGLAALSNKQGDRAMNLVARQRYTTALKQTGQLIAAGTGNSSSVISPLRAVVQLALFELVQGKGSKLSTGVANVHIFGGIALLKNVVPSTRLPVAVARGILQLMFSLFIPCQMTDTPLSPQVYEILAMSRQMLPPEEHCCCDLATAIAEFLNILTLSKSPQLVDGQPEAENIFQLLLGTHTTLQHIEEQLGVPFPFTVEIAPDDLHAQATFRGKYHRYIEIEGARLWNHLRWARILCVQRILELCKAFPVSSSRSITSAQEADCYATSRRMAEDIITSTPTHWHHPILSDTQARRLSATGRGGAGAAGIPGLLWHLKIAGCAPGVPQEFWDWSYMVAQLVWKTMGMQHALALAEVMEGHRAGLEKEAINRLIKIEQDDD